MSNLTNGINCAVEKEVHGRGYFQNDRQCPKMTDDVILMEKVYGCMIYSKKNRDDCGGAKEEGGKKQNTRTLSRKNTQKNTLKIKYSP